MASMPYVMQQTPPAGGIYSEAAAHGSHSRGSVGPLIVVLAVITILGVAAGMVGRMCAGRRFRRDREYDFEGWIERKCATCIDGSLESGGGGGGAAVPVAKPAENVEAPPDKPAEGGAPGG
ncbi:hypothetical protein SUGI_0563690 [Cryptomeria japonica]|uniref:uncharacterized protein LOC131052723 n=1 Tax=Cryptomeria japonica TaxID=3369 RepID=UPI002408D0F6|nr:uncharacterized protein LOC131052723 [Cryptomeria japonica]GLJ28606.1 hypothetical protein SUGI_0563690 [Cryptomeria japonica]